MEILQSEQQSQLAILYHYTSSDGLIGILQSCELWATDARFLNDTSELHSGREIARQVISDAADRTTERFDAQFLRSVERRLDLMDNISILVCSFSEVGDSLPQWREYADRGHGFALGFDCNALHLLRERTGFSLGRCAYSPKEQADLVHAALGQGLSLMRTGFQSDAWTDEVSKARDTTVELVAQCIPLLKNFAFRSEAEWRLVAQGGTELPTFLRKSGRTVVPYVRIPMDREHRNSGLCEIVSGPGQDHRLVRDAVNLYLGQNWGIESPVLSQSRIPLRSV